jgi:hypothetical protein
MGQRLCGQVQIVEGGVMKTRAVRLYGKHDLRLEEVELPPLQDDQILAWIVSDSVCKSTYKFEEKGTSDWVPSPASTWVGWPT